MLGRIIPLLFILSFINAQIALPTFQAVHKPHSTASSTGPVTFTNCGATGVNGPTQNQANSTYTSGNSLYGTVTINTQGIQEWTVPTSGSYNIIVRGASGNRHSTSTTKKFGTGAKLIGTFSLTSGTVLSILVGQMGSTNNSEWCGCGGGGGSYVIKKSGNIPLIIASGGAGGDGSGNYTNRSKPGGSKTTGNDVQATTQGNQKSSGAGGGFTYDGQDGNQTGGGSSFLNGGVGGTCNYGSGVAHGGFGGGGGGTWWSMGGAGGGYQGGSTISGYGNSSGPQTAYSYNTGSNTSGSQDGTQQTAADSLMHGYVIITW